MRHNVATDTSTYATPVSGGTAVVDADTVADGCTVAAETADAKGDAGRVDEGAPTCALDNGATDDALNDSDDNPGNSDDVRDPSAFGLAPLEQPASIPNTARLTPAHRRPRICPV